MNSPVLRQGWPTKCVPYIDAKLDIPDSIMYARNKLQGRELMLSERWHEWSGAGEWSGSGRGLVSSRFLGHSEVTDFIRFDGSHLRVYKFTLALVVLFRREQEEGQGRR